MSLIRVGNFWNKNYIECENNGNRKTNQSVKEYLNKMKPYLKYIITDLQKLDTRKIPLAVAIIRAISSCNC